MRIKAIITAGGTSSRFGNTNKLLATLGDKEVIKHTVARFLAVGDIVEIIICANSSLMEKFEEMFANEPKVKINVGGVNRQASVYNGIIAADECDFVLIHDGARPLVAVDTIKTCIKEVKTKKAISVMTKTTDTIKEVDETGKIVRTIDRTKLYNTQTPQAFDYSLIRAAHEHFRGGSFTDDAGLVEAYGYNVYIVENNNKNIKITSKSDIVIANAYLQTDED